MNDRVSNRESTFSQKKENIMIGQLQEKSGRLTKMDANGRPKFTSHAMTDLGDFDMDAILSRLYALEDYWDKH